MGESRRLSRPALNRTMLRATSLSCLIAASVLTAPSQAQQVFEIYPGVTSFASRGSLGGALGEVQQGFHSAANRGLGDNGSFCAVRGVRAVVQDQNDATVEPFRYVLRSGSDASGPTPTAAGLIATLGPYTLPAGGGAVTSFQVTTSFGTPITVPCSAFFSVGVELPANANWSNDGLSIHSSVNTVQMQHASAVDSAWQILGGTASHPSSKRSWRIGLLLPQNAFQAGNVVAGSPAARFGIGGYFPDTSLTGSGPSSQGLAFRCFDNDGANAIAVVMMAIDFGNDPVALFGVANRAHFNLATVAPFSLVTGPADGTTLPYAPAGGNTLPSAAGLRVCFQAVVAHPLTGVLAFSNAVVTTLL